MNWKKASSVNKKLPLIIIAGPTGVGKTGLSIALAREFGGEIINADSMQIYRLMDIGTAKPSPEERKLAPHHLLDIVYPDEVYNAASYRQDAERVIGDISGREKCTFVVGGTGLYIKALTRGLFYLPVADETIRRTLRDEMEKNGPDRLYAELKEVDPKSAENIHGHDKVRILRAIEVFRLTGKPISVYQSEHEFSDSKYDTFKIGLELDRDKLYERIEIRAHEMLEAGLIDEVRELLAAGYANDLKPMQSLGYRHVIRYLEDEYTFDEMLRTMIRDTRRYAKRQLTWFRGDPEIRWYAPSDLSGISQQVRLFLQKS
ncbi:MAG: tRNA (adenosine(37)-N6)-dimethylallyltransferase MiaA [Deltaproteobacteria bacterium]|nr:MAG: tRNA (adenosine(37)-N6)-dimethylallyltransferase MiaA [Deltaproteobacteria bacterium]